MRSIDVYENLNHKKITEENLLLPKNYYGFSKMYNESTIKEKLKNTSISILRLPGVSEASAYNQYIIGFSREATHYSDLNYSSAAYIQGILANGYHVGLSYNTNHKFLKLGEKVVSEPYLSFHLHKSVFKGNNITIDIGVHDMLYTAESPHRVSLFSLFSYSHQFNNKYKFDCSFGLGTGYVSADSHNHTDIN